MREKLRIFPYGRYMVGNVVILASWRYSQVQDRSVPMDFLHTPEHAVIIDDLIIVGRRLLRTYITREARM